MGAKKPVVLFFPSYYSDEAAPPLALIHLAAPLVAAGHEVRIVDSAVEGDPERAVLDAVLERQEVGTVQPRRDLRRSQQPFRHPLILSTEHQITRVGVAGLAEHHWDVLPKDVAWGGPQHAGASPAALSAANRPRGRPRSVACPRGLGGRVVATMDQRPASAGPGRGGRG